MKTKYISSPNKPIPGLGNVIPPVLEEKILEESNYSKGMFPDIDSSNISSGGLTLAKNTVSRDDKISRRPGNSIFTPISPDGNRVIRLIDYVRGNGVTNIIRHSKSSVYYLTSSAWIQATGPVLLGNDFDYINSVVIDDRYFFTNNGKNVIMELDLSANTYFANGNAPKYKKITGFYNRLVGANLQGGSPNPVNIGWSGDLNFSEWLSVNDVSAGTENLVDTNVDISDFITDIFGFDAVMIILRQKSIWVATKQPSASNPFNIYNQIPGQGCTCTYGAVKFPKGIIFPDLRTKSIYTFLTDGSIEDIGFGVRREIMKAIINPDQVFSSYNPIESEFSISIPNEITSITKEWRFNFRSKGWTYNELSAVSAMSDVDNIAGSRTIDELQGTIDNLLGTIDDLSTPISQLPRRIYGRYDGEIIIESNGQIIDAVFSEGYGYNYGNDYGGTLALLPVNFESELESKTYLHPGHNIQISTVMYEVLCRTIGTFTLSYSNDGGNSFTTQRTFDITNNMLNTVIGLYNRKQYLSRRFKWKLTTSDVDFDLISDTIKYYPLTALDK